MIEVPVLDKNKQVSHITHLHLQKFKGKWKENIKNKCPWTTVVHICVL